VSPVLVPIPEGREDDDDVVFVIGCDSRARDFSDNPFFCGGKCNVVGE
jgi:hypothetical protein